MQEKVAKVCVYIAKAMEDYASLGTDDCVIVNRYLVEAMKLASNHLTESNQQKFANWLLSKCNKEEHP